MEKPLPKNDTAFMCQMCGKTRYNRAGSSLSSYDAECWNAFVKERYRRSKEGVRFTIKMYREYRIAQGLPVPEKPAEPGRKPGNTGAKSSWTCPTCNEPKINQRSEYGFCLTCEVNAREWHLVDQRITPEVFEFVQRSSTGGAQPRGYFGKPYFNLPRKVTSQLNTLLEQMTPTVRAQLLQFMFDNYGWRP